MRLQTLLHRNGPALGLTVLFALANPTAVYSADSPQVQDLERRIAELERMLLDIRQAQAQTQVQASAPSGGCPCEGSCSSRQQLWQ